MIRRFALITRAYGANANGIRQEIEQLVKREPVVLFMKGSPEAPQCGFSATVTRLLNAEGAKFEYRNVLENEELRNEIKKFSDWPTIPQLYINGEFVGGCDIVTDLWKTGELTKQLSDAGAVKQ